MMTHEHDDACIQGQRTAGPVATSYCTVYSLLGLTLRPDLLLPADYVRPVLVYRSIQVYVDQSDYT